MPDTTAGHARHTYTSICNAKSLTGRSRSGILCKAPIQPEQIGLAREPWRHGRRTPRRMLVRTEQAETTGNEYSLIGIFLLKLRKKVCNVGLRTRDLLKRRKPGFFGVKACPDLLHKSRTQWCFYGLWQIGDIMCFDPE